MNLSDRLDNFWMKEAHRYAERAPPCYSEYRREWAQLLLHYEPKTLLEVGCNAGQNLVAIYALNPKVDLWGCDLAHVSPEDLMEIWGFRQGSVTNLPFHADFADMVMTHGLLMHISPDRVEKAISELVRVSSSLVAIREDVEIKGDGSYYGEPKAIFIHDYEQLFGKLWVKYRHRGEFLGYKRFTGVFQK